MPLSDAQNKSQKLREELRKKNKQEESREKLVRRIVVLISSVLAISLIGFVSWSVVSTIRENEKNGTSSTSELDKGEQLTPNNIDANGAFHITKGVVSTDSTPTGKKRVDIFFDPMCPGCGIVDRSIGSDLTTMSKEDTIDLYLRPVAFLDSLSTDKYSTRSINALVTVAEKDPQHFVAFMNALYEEGTQPEEGASYVSVSDDALATIAEEVGVSQDITKSFSDHNYVDWITKNSKTQMSNETLFPQPAGFSTPAVFIGITYNNEGIEENFTKVSFDNNDVRGTFLKALQ